MSYNDVCVSVYKVCGDAIIPFKGTMMSACYDIHACLHVPTVKVFGSTGTIPVETSSRYNKPFIRMYPNDLALIPTGLVFLLPETHHLKIYSRSGNVWKRLLKVGNQPAVIDSDYIYETFVLLHNRSSDIQIIQTGDAIAQCEICRNTIVSFNNVNAEQFERISSIMRNDSDRRGGFGSTGR